MAVVSLVRQVCPLVTQNLCVSLALSMFALLVVGKCLVSLGFRLQGAGNTPTSQLSHKAGQ
jgi:hypothetical protein